MKYTNIHNMHEEDTHKVCLLFLDHCPSFGVFSLLYFPMYRGRFVIETRQRATCACVNGCLRFSFIAPYNYFFASFVSRSLEERIAVFKISDNNLKKIRRRGGKTHTHTYMHTWNFCNFFPNLCSTHGNSFNYTKTKRKSYTHLRVCWELCQKFGQSVF